MERSENRQDLWKPVERSVWFQPRSVRDRALGRASRSTHPAARV